MLSARGQMSSLLPLRVIKISLSLKMTFSVSLYGCVILFFFFFFFSPGRQSTLEFMEWDVEYD